MSDHHWIGLGYASMTQSQAAEWMGARWQAVLTPLAFQVEDVFCRTCGASTEGAAPDCPGPEMEPTAHRWICLMSVEMNDEEAVSWATDAEPRLTLLPQSLNVVCRFCGQPAEVADDTCSERSIEKPQADD
jgi:hypothetical protein